MKYTWVLPVAVVAFLLVAVGFWGYNQYEERQQMQVYLGNQYNESFYKLVEQIEDVTALLGKGVVATGQTQFVTLLSDCWRQAMAAQESLNNLPISNATLVDTSKFLTQVGDYSMVLARQNLQQRTVTEEEKDRLKSLRAKSAELSETLHNIAASVNQGDINWWEVVTKTSRAIEREDETYTPESFTPLVEPNEPFPTLIYDGPFSDHIDAENPKGLTGEVVNKDRAREVASSFPDYPENQNLVVKDFEEDIKGKIEAYIFSVQPDDNEENHSLIQVTKKGGHVIMYMNPRNIGQRKISRVDAINKGDQFLKSRKLTNMVPTYSWIEDDVLTVSYAYKQDDVIIYPDLIKLKIAMDNGQIIGYDALGFLMSHTQRDLQEPEVNEEEVKSYLDAKFQVEVVRLAVIPTSALKEIFTWEARVSYEEETYLFYYDVSTGEEVNILRVIDTPEGTFAE